MQRTDAERIDLIIPVYNEVAQLEASVRRLALYAGDALPQPWRIVIVDNGSGDGTGDIGRRLAAESSLVQYVHLDVKGRGRALRKVWTETDACYSLYMDVDLSTDLSAIPLAVRLLEEGADLVSGSRLAPAARTTRCLKREVLSRIYNWLVRWSLGTRSFDDAQCGFKGVRIRTIRPLLALVENQHWFFDTELLVLAELAGLTIRTFPVTWVEDEDSRVNIPKTVLEDLRGLARLRRTARPLAAAWRQQHAPGAAGHPIPPPHWRRELAAGDANIPNRTADSAEERGGKGL